MFLLPLFVVYCALIVNLGTGDSCSVDPSEKQYRSFGTKTTYEQARKELDSKEWSPKDKYTPIFAYGFIRHGIRYPDRDDIINMHKFIKDNPFPATMDTDKCPKSNWPPMRMKPDDDNHISPSGGSELEEIAARFSKRLPSLFAKPEMIEIGISEKIRTTESAENFFRGLNKAVSSSAPLRVTKMSICSYHDQCETIAGGKLNEKPKKKAVKEFEARADVQNLIRSLSEKLSLNITLKEMKLISKACSFSLALYNEYAPLCSMMSYDDHQLMDLMADIDDYYGDAYGASQTVQQMPCTVIQDFIEQVNSIEVSIDGNSFNVSKPAALRFSHAGAVKPLVAHLGLAEDPINLMNPATISPSAARKWHSSRLAPFASNIFFVVLVKDKKLNKWAKKSRKGKDFDIEDDDLYVATLVQERLMQLDNCGGDDGLCKFENFIKRAKRKTGSDGCDLNAICKKS